MRRTSNVSIFLGAAYLILGIIALMFAGATTLASVLVLAAVFLVAGVVEIVYAIQGRKEGALWPHLGLGALALVCSFLIFRNPIENTMGLTLIISFLLIAAGLTRVIGSSVERPVGWGWLATSGVISIILGGMILFTFPASAIWTIGTFVGVDLIATGATLIGLGTSIKRFQKNLSSSRVQRGDNQERVQRPLSRERPDRDSDTLSR
ncbi:hypothetical protein BDW_03040 [Bdellovibrio bacteriovorus W]|nr:hypothetical protein BDW_03040 [Bdellovibrio bacteriovorus W]